jgi:hypothetical protein
MKEVFYGTATRGTVAVAHRGTLHLLGKDWSLFNGAKLDGVVRKPGHVPGQAADLLLGVVDGALVLAVALRVKLCQVDLVNLSWAKCYETFYGRNFNIFIKS